MPSRMESMFAFSTQADTDAPLMVVNFTGTEALNAPYRFEIVLISRAKDLDVEELLQKDACLSIKRRGKEDIRINGILVEFERRQYYQGYTFYHAVLVPNLWWLVLTHHNQVFLNKNVKSFLTELLEDAGMRKKNDFEFRLQNRYEPWEYVCQYGESHFNFLSRWLERYGMAYFFEQQADNEVLVVADSQTVFQHLEEDHILTYSPVSGLLPPQEQELAVRFERQEQTLPQTVRVKDYNYTTPRLAIEAQETVCEQGVGEIYYYGEHARTPSEAAMLAKIRAEEFLCRKETVSAWTTSPTIRAGYLFSLQEHPEPERNTDYLALEVHHSGDQRAYLEAGLGVSLGDKEAQLYYHNTVTAIPAAAPYRPVRDTPKTLFYGSIRAKVDAEGSGDYAKVDDQGRYKIILPFDLSGRSEGKASSWIRMAQPYGGSSCGMHFPLHKGTEVLLSFDQGDPDRPVILGGLPDPEHPSQVVAENQTKCVLTTSGGNHIHFENKEGSQRVLMRSPSADTFLRLGAPNDPATATHIDDGKGEWGTRLYTSNHLDVDAGVKNVVIAPGESFACVGGSNDLVVVGNNTTLCDIFSQNTMLGLQITFDLGGTTKMFPGAWTDVRKDRSLLALSHMELHAETSRLESLKTQLSENRQTLVENLNRLIADQQQLVQTKNDLTGEVQTLDTAFTELTGQKNGLTTANEELAGEVSELREQNSALTGSVEQLQGEITELGRQKNALRAEITRINLQRLELAPRRMDSRTVNALI